MACAGSSAHITRGDALPFMRLSHRRTPRVLPMTCPAIPHGSIKGGPSGLTPLRTYTDMRHPGAMGPLFRWLRACAPIPSPPRVEDWAQYLFRERDTYTHKRVPNPVSLRAYESVVLPLTEPVPKPPTLMTPESHLARGVGAVKQASGKSGRTARERPETPETAQTTGAQLGKEHRHLRTMNAGRRPAARAPKPAVRP